MVLLKNKLNIALKLGDLAEVFFGPYHKAQAAGDTRYILASHFDELLKPTLFELSYVELAEQKDKALLQPNDVLLAGKGQRNFAWAYKTDFGPCVPSSLFFVIRANEDLILGDYLAHFLNTEKVQNKLKEIGAGGTIPSIPKKELQQLSVIVPTIREQQNIVAMAAMIQEDLDLTAQLLEKKRTLSRTILNTLIMNQNE